MRREAGYRSWIQKTHIQQISSYSTSVTFTPNFIGRARFADRSAGLGMVRPEVMPRNAKRWRKASVKAAKKKPRFGVVFKTGQLSSMRCASKRPQRLEAESQELRSLEDEKNMRKQTKLALLAALIGVVL